MWTFCAIDADTKLVPSFKVGKRDNATANAFVQDIAARMKVRVQISTDGLRAYVDAIDNSFGTDVDYAQIIKTYGTPLDETERQRRYSPAVCTGATKTAVMGNPDMDKVSTSYVERVRCRRRRLIDCIARGGYRLRLDQARLCCGR